MEQDQTSSLFSLSIDPVTKGHLAEAAKWAKFLAIVGMVFIALLVLFGVFGSAMLFSVMGSGNLGNEYGSGATSTYTSILIGVYVVAVAVLWFFPLLFTLRFSNKMKAALAGNDQQALNTSFQNLKICLRFLGIVTIIVLALYAIILIFALITAGASL